MTTKKIIALFMAVVTVITLALPATAQYTPDFDLQSQTVLLLNVDTGKVMYEKNADQQTYPASLTKIMTAILVLEHVEDLDGTMITIKPYIQDMLIGTGASLGGILPGESVSVRGLLHAAMMQSANEAALMLADYVGDGSLTQFVEMMNQKAVELGCTDTNFANPTGLHDDNHYTTAQDMAKIALYAIENPTLMEIVNSVTKEIGPTNMHDSLIQVTTNLAITPQSSYYNPSISGLKTGTTNEAGRCFASTATRDGFTYMCILMGAPIYDQNGEAYPTYLNFEETTKLYDWVFSSFKVKTVVEEGRYVADVPVELSLERDVVGLVSDQRLTAMLPENVEVAGVQFVPKLPESIDAPVEKGQKVGTLELYLAGEKLGEVGLITNDSVELSSVLYYYDAVITFFDSFWAKFALIFVVLLVVVYVAYMMLRNRNRQSRRRRRPPSRRRRL